MGSATNYAIHLMRLLTRPNCIFRYSCPQNAAISESGRVNVFLTTEAQNVISHEDWKFNMPDLESWKPIIKDLKNYCNEQGIKLAMFISRSHLSDKGRRNFAGVALSFMDMGLPVLKDSYLGCWPDSSMYSDSANHLSVEAGKAYSEFLAIQIKNNQYWTRDELLQIIYTP